ncbi:hypothetical protein [Tetragenococcus muriaticus]|uniref:hypothetical protein n=1 Tax=Tetragenococcus muriaticus TaxID=64642 RepID=UPI001E391442|nr:hypothetical protein [Tetragenococcus muriaticus]
MQTTELNQLVQDYQRLFHKVLRKCSIFPGQPDYEDHMQELRLLFFLKPNLTNHEAYLKQNVT